jgi:PKD repeat protein
LTPTPGAANRLSSTPHVAISEIMYHPAPTVPNPENNENDEFIELYNPTDQSVGLTNVADDVGGIWRLNGGIEYTFPTGTVIPAGGYLVVVPFDPVTDTVARTNFLATYGLTNGQIRMVGPYSGKLDNRGEQVRLERPVFGDLPGDATSWFRIDTVTYFDQSPWPTNCDATGRSLQRMVGRWSGDDPALWRGESATPGAGSSSLSLLLECSASTLFVPVGGTKTFQVRLPPPTGTVVVTVARTAGADSISIQSGSNLVFTAGNWRTNQTVTVAASAGVTNGTATITCSAAGLPSVAVTAIVDRLPVIAEGASVDVTMDEDGAPTAFARTLNATDAEGDTLTWSISSAPGHGSASASGTGGSKVIGYIPTADYNGPDSFVVQVADGRAGPDTITVNVTIQPVNDAPTAVASACPLYGLAPMTVAFTATGADVDVGDTTLNYAWTFGDGGTSTDRNPSHTYMSPGSYTSRITVSDGNGGTGTATVLIKVAAGITATGGTVVDYEENGVTWRAHIFTNSGANYFDVGHAGTNDVVEYLIVAGGGGGGGGHQGGGGGAGGMLTGTTSIVTGSLSVVVGGGGGGCNRSGGNVAGNGTDSSFAGVVALGGGRGASEGPTANAAVGGSGGGGCHYQSPLNTGANGTQGQGHKGGNTTTTTCGAGGGGAGGAGQDNDGEPIAAGGPGVASAISGARVTYAAGGLGRNRMETLINGDHGIAGTGNGGDGGRVYPSMGGNGGSGIVIVRYRVRLPGAANQAPTALTATAVNTHQIQLAWTDNATNETGYVLDRSPDGSTWNALTSLVANATAYTDDGLTASTRYYYRVAATNSDGLSAYASANATTFTNPPPSAILTSVSSMSVPEGGTTTFLVWLSSQPTSGVTVAVAWASGDTNITVTGGANLTFTTNNWATYQTVTLAAAEDADTVNGSATITCSGAGLTSGSVTAAEVDNDTTLTVNSGPGGSTTPSGATVATQGAARGISATAGAGYAFANWSVTSGAATFANSNASSTTVTISSPTTVQANFIRVAILTSAPFVGVPEGGTAKFRVSLSAQPAGSVTVSVAHGGDSQLSVMSGGSLVFSPSNWNLWKTVTLADAEDGVTNRRVATFTCSAAGMDPVTVTATGIDNDGPVLVDSDGDGLPDALEARLGRATNAIETLKALPFAERFESDTVSPGLLHGQHNWMVNPTNGATVQTGEVFEGVRALQIQGTNDSSVAVSQAFTSTPQTVWLDLRLKVAGAAIPGSIPDAASVFFFNDAGQLVVCDGMQSAGTQWITLTNTASRQAGTWARLTASADYVLQTWSLYLDGTNVASNLGFAVPQKRLTCLSLEGPAAVVDNLTVGYGRPDGIPGSSNEAPDDWYLDHFGTLAYSDTDDPDHDGMSNLAEYIAGTDPNDPASLLKVTDAFTANPDKFVVRWQSATGRVYTVQVATNLLNVFGTLTNGIPATPMVNVYTDIVNGVGQKFYRIKVE